MGTLVTLEDGAISIRASQVDAALAALKRAFARGSPLVDGAALSEALTLDQAFSAAGFALVWDGPRVAGVTHPSDKLRSGADMTNVVAFFDCITELVDGVMIFIEHGDEETFHRLTFRKRGVVWSSGSAAILRFEQQVERARATRSRDAREAALALADAAIEASVARGEAWGTWHNRRAKIELLAQLGRLPETEPLLALAPDEHERAQGHDLVADCSKAAGRLEDAEAAVRRGLAVVESAPRLCALARILWSRAQIGPALDAAERAFAQRRGPHDVYDSPHLELCHVAGRHARLIEVATAVYGGKAGFGVADRVGLAHLELGNEDAAFAALGAKTRMGNVYMGTWLYVCAAQALVGLGRAKDARAAFRRVDKALARAIEKSDGAYLRWMRAEVSLGLGKVEQAAADVARALALEPSPRGRSREERLVFGRVALAQGEAGVAAESARDVLQWWPVWPEASLLLAGALRVQGELDAARTLLLDVVSARPFSRRRAELDPQLSPLLAAGSPRP